MNEDYQAVVDRFFTRNMRVVGKERAAEIHLFSKACCECSSCKRNEEREDQ